MLDREVVERLGQLHAIACGTLSMYGSREAIENAKHEVLEAVPELLRVYRMWMEASVVKVERRTATFGHGDHGSQYVIGDDYMGTPAFNDLVGQRVRLVRDGEPGEGES